MASVRIICRCHPWAAFWWESLQKSLTKSTRRSLFFFWTSVTTGIAKYGLAQRGGPHQSALGQSRHPSSSWRTKRVQRQYQRQGCDCRDIVRQPLGAGATFFSTTGHNESKLRSSKAEANNARRPAATQAVPHAARSWADCGGAGRWGHSASIRSQRALGPRTTNKALDCAT